MRFTLITITYLFFSLIHFAEARERSWTYFFYIAGDNYYHGPVWPTVPSEGGTVVEEDQAFRLYKSVKAKALHDQNNNYAIFYDPRGGNFARSNRFLSSRRRRMPRLRTGKHVRFEYYRKGVLRRENSYYHYETDMTNPKNFRRLVGEAYRYIGRNTIKNRNIMLYYYGEHISAHESPFDYDHSVKKSQMTIDKFIKGIKYFKYLGPINLLVMHSCYVNTVGFVDGVRPYVQNILMSPVGIPRATMNLTSLKNTVRSSAEVLAQKIIKDNPSKPYPFKFVYYSLNEKYDQLRRSLKALLKASDQQSLEKAKTTILSNYQNVDPYSQPQPDITEIFPNGLIYLPFTKELLVNILDYISFLQSHVDDEELLFSLLEFLEANSVFSELRVLLNP